MKKILMLLMGFLFFACSANTSNQGLVETADLSSTRGVETVYFQGSQVSVSKENIFIVKKMENARQDDDVVNVIMRSLMGAENISQVLDVKFTMSDEPVEEGLFVFSINSEQEKSLTMEMYDEEGFEMAANNVININEGNNYKALNVKSLEDGTYFFKLKDSEGKELVREVTIRSKD